MMINHDRWTDEELASAWIRRYSGERRRIVSATNANAEALASDRIESETAWAFDVLFRLSLQKPEHAWRIILSILKLAGDDDNVLDNLASGPLETLLRQHGGTVIEWVEGEAYRNPQFKALLDGVWPSNSSDPLWERVKRAAEN